MRTLSSRSSRVVFTSAVAALAFGAPGAASALGDADLTVIGGDASDVVNCTNDGDGKQRNRCDAKASGGDVDLRDVDIHFSGTEPKMQVNGGAVDVLSIGGGSAEAGAVCLNESGTRVKQLSICRVKSQGGAVSMRNVEMVVHRADGSTRRSRRDLFAVGHRPAPSHAHCVSLSTRRCDASAGGGAVAIHDVKVFDRATGVTRNGIDVIVRGGAATASVFCGNFGGSGPLQMNHCSATALGGDATLRNVRLHVYQR